MACRVAARNVSVCGGSSPPSLRYGAALFVLRYAASEDWCLFIPPLEPFFKVEAAGIEPFRVAASDDGTWNGSVSAALVNHFKGEPIHLISSFFKPAFVSDGLINDVFADSSDLFDRLELSKSLDGVLLAREQVQYSTTPSLDNLISANIELDIATLPIGSNGVQNRTWTLTAAGSGFTRPEAHKMAEDRIVKQILNDTNMTLN